MILQINLITLFLLLSSQVHKVFSDDADDRHNLYHPSYDVENPPSTTLEQIPTLLPTLTTTILSTPCQIDSNGDYGNTTGLVKERVDFRYEVEFNATYLSTQSDNYANETETIILPLIENEMLGLLFPYIFAECIDENGNITAVFSNIEGISSQPKDLLADAECNSMASPDTICFPIDAEFSLFFKSRRRLTEDREEVKQVNQIIKTAMAENRLNSAHPAIVGIVYIETDTNPVIDPNSNKKIDDGLGNDGNSTWWKIVLGVGIAGFLIAVITLIWRKRRDRDNDDDDDDDDDKLSVVCSTVGSS